MLTDRIRRYLADVPLGRLATVDAEAQPHVVPVCFAVHDNQFVTPIDEKDKRVGADRLRRVQNVQTNPRVALVVDHYAEDWADLGWVQVRGTAVLSESTAPGHEGAIERLEVKYPQYESHDLANRPLLRVVPETIRSWGDLEDANAL